MFGPITRFGAKADKWECFLAPFQQQMKDNPALKKNCRAGRHRLSFLIKGGRVEASRALTCTPCDRTYRTKTSNFWGIFFVLVCQNHKTNVASCSVSSCTLSAEGKAGCCKGERLIWPPWQFYQKWEFLLEKQKTSCLQEQ